VDACRTRSSALINGGVERSAGRGDVVLPPLFVRSASASTWCEPMTASKVDRRDVAPDKGRLGWPNGRTSTHPTGSIGRTQVLQAFTKFRDLKPFSRDQERREAWLSWERGAARVERRPSGASLSRQNLELRAIGPGAA
jgi:hypothetical protein